MDRTTTERLLLCADTDADAVPGASVRSGCARRAQAAPERDGSR